MIRIADIDFYIAHKYPYLCEMPEYIIPVCPTVNMLYKESLYVSRLLLCKPSLAQRGFIQSRPGPDVPARLINSPAGRGAQRLNGVC